MDLKQRFIYKSAVGFSLGVFLTIFINVIVNFLLSGSLQDNPYSEIRNSMDFIKIMLELLTGGMLGCVGNGGSVVYEIENWSIFRATATHFIVTMTVYVIVGLYNGWLLPKHSMVNVVQIGMMVFVYVLIWLSQYLVYKKSINDINEGMKYFKNGEKIY